MNFFVTAAILLTAPIAHASFIGITSESNSIHLVEETAPGALVDWNGNATSTSLGTAHDIAWDPVSRNLVALVGNRLWRNSGSGWSSTVEFSALAMSDNNVNLAISPQGRIAMISASNSIHLVDESVAGGLVDWAGNPTSSPIGNGHDIAWDPTTGELVASAGSNTIWRNSGLGWSGTQLTALAGGFGATSDLTISPQGRIAVTSVASTTGDVFLVDESASGGIVDWTGSPTSGRVGTAYDIAWDPATGELVALLGNHIWRNAGAGWSGIELSALTGGVGENMSLAVIPEPMTTVLTFSVVALLAVFARLRKKTTRI